MIIGIDLGTTNSLVAVFKDGAPVLIPNRLGDVLTPSVVSLDKAGTVITGRAARERLASHPLSTAAAFKRSMGTQKTYRLDGRDFRAEELSGLLLRSLKEDAEDWLGERVTEAIITVPAYFNDTQRKATRLAGELAGLKVDRLLNEPTAAAMAYGLNDMPDDSRFIVVDLGGGTFDVSILQLFSGVMEVRASAGDNWLGGEDFNAVLASLLRERLLALGVPEAELPAPAQWLLEAERTRRALTRDAEVVAEIAAAGQMYKVTITREAFERASGALLDRLRTPIERAIRDARLSLSEINEVVLAGGATRMPMVRQTIARLFGRFPAARIDPDTVVALGAAVQAGLMMRDAALDEVVMTDVAPYSMGVETAVSVADGQTVSGMFSPVIERNTVVPVSRVERFNAVHPEQTQVMLRVYQGEARHCQDNIFLGELEIAVPKASSREDGQPAPIDVRFTYDVSGLLEVDARVNDTGAARTLVIERTPGTMSAEQMAALRERMARLKVHPRDQAHNLALLARAERIYSQSLREVRQAVGTGMARFEAALHAQDEDRIRLEHKALAEFLDTVDRDPFAS